MQGAFRLETIAIFLFFFFFFSGSAVPVFAQEAQGASSTTPTPPVPPTRPAPTIPAEDSGQSGGFSDYVNGLPTKFTLPNGTVVDLSIPENTVPETSMTLFPTPKVPKAFEEVKLRLENFSTKLEEDRIIWMVDGNVVKDEIGGDEISARMGAIGQTLRIHVVVDSRSLGKRLTKDLAITSGDVAILWEANTYIPPFYKGKPLPSYKSTIKLIPFPTMVVGNKHIAPENLLYKWTRNYRNIKDISGYGKRYSFLETGGGVQEERLSLHVSHPDSGAETEREVVIKVVEPKVLIYAGSPLQGIRYEAALGRTYSLSTQETTLRGEPFFFSKEELESGASPLLWKQNNKPIPSLYQSVVLQKPGEEGTSQIDASIENPNRILQSARTGVSIVYKKNDL